MTDRAERFIYENQSDSDNELQVYIETDPYGYREHKGWLCVSVSDEKAVDSYNSLFTCDIHLPLDVARKLRDYLNQKLRE